MKAFVALGAVVVFAASASAQRIDDRATLVSLLGGPGTLDDFETYSVGTGGAVGSIGVTVLDEASVTFDGQGPGLVNDGASYLVSSALQWNGDAYYGLVTKSILGNSGDSLITIRYDTPTQAMGVDLKAFSGFGETSSVSVFNTGGGLIESFSIGVPGPSPVFFGYRADGGIGSVQIRSETWSWSTIIDDHQYGLIPAPGALAGLGLAMAFRRRR